MTLLRALMRHSVVSLKASDAKEVASSMTVIANEKLKAEKDAAAGKKKTGNYTLPICAGMCKVGDVCCKIVVVSRSSCIAWTFLRFAGLRGEACFYRLAV